MNFFKALGILAIFGTVGTAQAVPPPIVSAPPRTSQNLCANGCLSPEQAVIFAAKAAPSGAVSGNFIMKVEAVGRQRDHYYLNSEKDYRDQTNLTIAIPNVVAQGILRKYNGNNLENVFKGRQIIVSGTAQRVRIGFFGNDGKQTDLYYYQTHVRVRNSGQITLL